MQQIMQVLKELDPNIESIGYIVSDESLALYRKELERAKRATGLNFEVEAQTYTTDPNNSEKVRYSVFLTNKDHSKVLFVGAEFPHIELYENAAQWHRTTHLNPKLTYQSGVKVDELFKKITQEIEF